MGKTNIEVDEDLLTRAMAVSEAGTQNEVVDLALRELIRQYLLRELRESLGTYDLDMDLQQLLEMRRYRDDKLDRLRQES